MSISRAAARRTGAAVLALALAMPSTAGAEPAPEVAPAEGEIKAAAEGDEPDPAATEAAPDPAAAETPVEDLSPEELAAIQKKVRVENAQKHYEQGTVLYGRGRYAEAAAEYEASHAAVPAAPTLYMMALSYERAGKAVEAVHTLQRYLALPDCGDLPRDKRTIGCTSRRVEAEQALTEQKRLVGSLRLDIADGVELREVRVAGQTVPLDDFPLLLRPGAVDVELFGLAPDQRRSRVAYITAGETFPLYVAPFETEVVRPPRPRIDPDPDPDLERQRQRQRILKISFWSGVGLTAASAIALGTMGGLTLSRQRSQISGKCEAECYERDPETGEFVIVDGQRVPKNTGYPESSRDDFLRYKPITNALVGVTIGLGVATALVGAFAFRKRNREQSRVRLQGPGLALRW